MNKTTEALKQLREVHEAQGRDGNWNYDHYMRGLFNGLELALAIFEDREPVYRKALAYPVIKDSFTTAEPVKQEPVAWTNYNGAVNNRLKAAPVQPVKQEPEHD